MPRSKKTQSNPKTQTTHTSVVDDFIDQNSSSEQERADIQDEIEVVAEHVDIANTMVSDVAVVKRSSEMSTEEVEDAASDSDIGEKDNHRSDKHGTKDSKEDHEPKHEPQQAPREAQTDKQSNNDSTDDSTDDNADAQDKKAAEQTVAEAANYHEHEGVHLPDESHQDSQGAKHETPEHEAPTDATSQADKTHKSEDAESPLVKFGGIGGLFAKVGSYLARTDAKEYQGVDLNAENFAKHAFYVQGSSLSDSVAKAVFGKNATTAQTLAHKFIPKDKLTAVSEGVYHKVADLAQTWAIKSIKEDPSTLTPAQKEKLAQSIANQNRLLATLGGVTGFFGLKGVVADTAWLLLVALRTVYQLATVYGVSLTGKDGIKMAYGVLSGASLDKMQEKQLILTALALLGNVLNQADKSSLKEELVKLSSSNTSLKEFDELLKFAHLETLADKYGVDIDKLNSRWLRRVASVSAVGVGAYYNRDLIDEVIGTALATFNVGTTKGIEYQSDV